MGEIDLIPSDYRQNIIHQYYWKKFILLCLLVLVSVALIKGLLSYLIWKENLQVTHLEQQQSIIEENNAKTESYKQQKQITEQQLVMLNELYGRDRVALFLKAVDVAYREGVWFDSVHFMREKKTATVAVAANSNVIVVGNSAESAHKVNVSQSVEILGHAISHSLLADFMRTLGAQPSITDLQLIDTGTKAYPTMQVIDFNLALQMDKQILDTKVHTLVQKQLQPQVKQ